MPITIKIPLAKRIFDILVAGTILTLISPIWILILILIFIEHTLRGHPLDPLFYKETRMSKGQPFTLYKFNIFDQRVIEDLRKNDIFIHTKKLEHTGKLILIGKILRQIYLDELPQLLNVLRGDMSLVGPRPLNIEVYANLKSENRTQAKIPAGITGLFQSYKGKDQKTSMELDAEYFRHFSTKSGLWIVAFDILILLRTVKVVLRARGI